MKSSSLSIISILLLFSCNKLNPTQYFEYINDPKNGLVNEKTFGSKTYRCEFKPTEFTLLNEKSKSFNGESQNKKTEELYSEANQFYTFFIRLSSTKSNDFLKDDLQNKDDYYSRLNYYNSEIQNDIILIQGKDTMPANYTYFERNFGVSNQSTLIVGFLKKDLQNKADLNLLIEERSFGLGLIAFNITNENISKIPKVKL